MEISFSSRTVRDVRELVGVRDDVCRVIGSCSANAGLNMWPRGLLGLCDHGGGWGVVIVADLSWFLSVHEGIEGLLFQFGDCRYRWSNVFHWYCKPVWSFVYVRFLLVFRWDPCIVENITAVRGE